MADVVLDASAATELLIDGPDAPAVQEAIKGHDLVVPAHFHAEVLGAIASLHGRGQISEDSATAAVAALAAIPAAAHRPDDLTGAWQRRGTCSMYDVLYVLLAESLDCRLVTMDKGQADACKGTWSGTGEPRSIHIPKSA